MPTETTILCEGYHDRAFWTGCLLKVGCQDAFLKAGGRVLDLGSKPVTGGQYGFWTSTGNFIRVVPCHGKENILPEAKNRMNRRLTDPITRLVINLDPDTSPGDPATGLELPHVLAFLKNFDPNAAIDAEGNVAIDNGAFLVNLIRWESNDTSPTLPPKQSLERLICACLDSAYPERTDPVLKWLGSRPSPPPFDPKERVWSHMAGWYADSGCDRFFKQLWEDEKIADEIIKRLEANGTWKVVEALAK